MMKTTFITYWGAQEITRHTVKILSEIKFELMHYTWQLAYWCLETCGQGINSSDLDILPIKISFTDKLNSTFKYYQLQFYDYEKDS